MENHLAAMHNSSLDISIVIPIYNEEAVLDALFNRLYPVMDGLDRSYEIIFVNDGSRDQSLQKLKSAFHDRPDVTRVVILHMNAGQHSAIMAGFEKSRGKMVITMDADLQNPPEEIPKLVSKFDEGFDYVGSIRKERRDVKWRHYASKLMNTIREKITSISMTDQGCMFRAYDRTIINAIVRSNESQTFIPALGYLYAAKPTEIVVEHDERLAGESKYSLFKLIHLNFDLITSFSLFPLQFFSLLGMLISSFSFVFAIYMGLRRVFLGPEVEGVFTLFAFVFFMIGLLLFAVGILGEYVGRIYREVKNRPRYIIATTLELKPEKEIDKKRSKGTAA